MKGSQGSSKNHEKNAGMLDFFQRVYTFDQNMNLLNMF